MYVDSSLENTGHYEHWFHVRGEAKHRNIGFTCEAKPNTGIIYKCIGKAFSERFMTDTFHQTV